MLKHRIICSLCTATLLLGPLNAAIAAGKKPPPKRSQQTQKQKNMAKAAALIAFVNKQPKHSSAAARLWNAAMLYSRMGRNQSSKRLYQRIVNQYPSWKMADQVLFRLAMQAERKLKFEQAMRHYLRLAQSRRFQNSKHRGDALYNAALLLESLQQYKKSGNAFRMHAMRVQSSDPRAAARSHYHAAIVYKKGKDTKSLIDTLKSFTQRYQKDPDQSRFIIQAHGLLMETYEAQGRGARFLAKQYKAVIRAYNTHKASLRPIDRTHTRHFPAKAAYKLVMPQYRAMVKRKLTGPTMAKLERQATALIKEYDSVAIQLGSGLSYGSAPWLLCTLFRIAEGKEKIAALIRQAPVPKGISPNWQPGIIFGSSKVHLYMVKALTNDAIKKYKKVLSEAQRLQLENDCTRQAQRALHKLDPKVPLPRKSSPLPLQLRLTSPLPLMRVLSPQVTKR